MIEEKINQEDSEIKEKEYWCLDGWLRVENCKYRKLGCHNKCYFDLPQKEKIKYLETMGD